MVNKPLYYSNSTVLLSNFISYSNLKNRFARVLIRNIYPTQPTLKKWDSLYAIISSIRSGFIAHIKNPMSV